MSDNTTPPPVASTSYKDNNNKHTVHEQTTNDPSNLYFSDTYTQSWSICTHNTRGFNEKIKQISLLKYCKNNHIDFLGITETSISTQTNLKDTTGNYQIITTKTTNTHIGTGVGII